MRLFAWPMSSVLKNDSDRMDQSKGFTMIELVMVVVILAILSAIAVPIFDFHTDLEAQNAAEVLAGDVCFAQALAVRQNNANSVTFDIDATGYTIRDDSGDVKRVTFGADDYECFGDTTLTGVDFTFDRSGAPSLEQQITVTSGTSILHVAITGETGRVGIQ